MHHKNLSSVVQGGCGSPVVKVSDHGRHVMSSSPEPLKPHRVRQRFTLNLSRAETSSRWCGVVVRRFKVFPRISSYKQSQKLGIPYYPTIS
ncbi:hypothetical protein TNCV_2340071 [Trichonephila clavipes]|nr:hypothetical protein TNCV_2340071 [Trichonephila clavipes]